jgi:hypothetical protein
MLLMVASAGDTTSSGSVAVAVTCFLGRRGRSQLGHTMPCEMDEPHRTQLLAMLKAGWKSYARLQPPAT